MTVQRKEFQTTDKSILSIHAAVRWDSMITVETLRGTDILPYHEWFLASLAYTFDASKSHPRASTI